MSDTAANKAAFDEIRALADVDYERAATLARDTQLIVRTSRGSTGVLTGVDWLGNPSIEMDQRRRTVTSYRFGEIEATGYAAEVPA